MEMVITPANKDKYKYKDRDRDRDIDRHRDRDIDRYSDRYRYRDRYRDRDRDRDIDRDRDRDRDIHRDRYKGIDRGKSPDNNRITKNVFSDDMQEQMKSIHRKMEEDAEQQRKINEAKSQKMQEEAKQQMLVEAKHRKMQEEAKQQMLVEAKQHEVNQQNMLAKAKQTYDKSSKIQIMGDCPTFLGRGSFNDAFIVKIGHEQRGDGKDGILRIESHSTSKQDDGKNTSRTRTINRTMAMSNLGIGPLIYDTFIISDLVHQKPFIWSNCRNFNIDKYKYKFAILMEKFEKDANTFFKEDKTYEFSQSIIVRSVIEQVEKLIDKTARNGTLLFDIKPNNIVLNQKVEINGHVGPDVRFIDFDDDYCADFDPSNTSLVNISRFVMCVLFKAFMSRHCPHIKVVWSIKTTEMLWDFVNKQTKNIMQIIPNDWQTKLRDICYHYHNMSPLHVLHRYHGIPMPSGVKLPFLMEKGDVHKPIFMKKTPSNAYIFFYEHSTYELSQNRDVTFVIEQIETLINNTAYNGTVLFDMCSKNIKLHETRKPNNTRIDVSFTANSTSREHFDSSDAHLTSISRLIMCVLFKAYMSKYQPHIKIVWSTQTVDFLNNIFKKNETNTIIQGLPDKWQQRLMNICARYYKMTPLHVLYRYHDVSDTVKLPDTVKLSDTPIDDLYNNDDMPGVMCTVS